MGDILKKSLQILLKKSNKDHEEGPNQGEEEKELLKRGNKDHEEGPNSGEEEKELLAISVKNLAETLRQLHEHLRMNQLDF